MTVGSSHPGRIAPRDVELSAEIVEYLERYAEHRCPELAGCLLEELAVRSQATDDELERCVCSSLLRHWLGVDRRRRGGAFATGPVAVAAGCGGRSS